MRDFINKIFKTSMFRGPASKHWGTALAVLGVVILFFIVSNAMAPAAVAATCPDGTPVADGEEFRCVDPHKPSFAPGGSSFVVEWLKDKIGGSIANALYYVILVPEGLLLSAAGKFANWMLQSGPITTSTVVLVGWGVTRDLANMLFILILLGVALDYILFQSFGVKRALPMLIVVALLINFSLPIAGIFIDFANVFTDFFMGKITAGCGITMAQHCGFTEAIANNLSLTSLFGVTDEKVTSSWGQGNLITDIIFAIFFMAGTIFIFLALGIMFLLRTGYLYALLILLPLVLVLKPFPPTSKYFGQWSNHFMKWTMFAPIASFFLYLSMLIFSANVNADVTKNTGNGIIEQVYTYILVWFFMLGSLMAAQAMSITGAGAAMGMIKGAQKWAGGRIKSGAKRGAEKAGVAKVLEKSAELAAKAPIVGGFGARIIGGIATNIRSAKKEAAELSQKDKDFIERSDEAMVTSTIEAYAIGTPDQRAKAAKMITLAEKKGKLKIKTNGVFDPKKTRELKRTLRAKAKTIGDIEAVKAIDRSDFVIGKEAITEKYNKLAKEAKYKDAAGNIVDPDTGKPVEEARQRKLADLYRKVNLASEEWDDTVIEDDPEFIRDMIKYEVLTAEKFKQAQRSGNTAIIKQFREYMKNPGDELTSEGNTAFRNWLRGTAAAGMVGDFTNQLNKMKRTAQKVQQGGDELEIMEQKLRDEVADFKKKKGYKKNEEEEEED